MSVALSCFCGSATQVGLAYIYNLGVHPDRHKAAGERSPPPKLGTADAEGGSTTRWQWPARVEEPDEAKIRTRSAMSGAVKDLAHPGHAVNSPRASGISAVSHPAAWCLFHPSPDPTSVDSLLFTAPQVSLKPPN
jgi:hypothetical protein